MNTKQKGPAPAEANDLEDLATRVKILETAARQHGWDLDGATDPSEPPPEL